MKTELQHGDYILAADVTTEPLLQGIHANALVLGAKEDPLSGRWHSPRRTDAPFLALWPQVHWCYNAEKSAVIGRRWDPTELQAAAIIQQESLPKQGWSVGPGRAPSGVTVERVITRDGRVLPRQSPVYKWPRDGSMTDVIAYQVESPAGVQAADREATTEPDRIELFRALAKGLPLDRLRVWSGELEQWLPAADMDLQGVAEAAQRGDVHVLSRTVTLDGVVLPRPLTRAPEMGAVYYVLAPAAETGVRVRRWLNDPEDRRLLGRGVCFGSHHEALDASDAVYGALSQEVEHGTE